MTTIPTPVRQAPGGSARSESAPRVATAGTRRDAMRRAWDSPVTSYYLVGGVVLVLLSLGLVFVLSSSTISSLRVSSDGGRTPFTDFRDQLMFGGLGLVLALITSRFGVRFLRLLAWPAFLGALGLQLLPLIGFGVGSGGNMAWAVIGPVSFQPSEFGKIGLALWLGAVLAAKQHVLHRWGHVIMPALVGAVAMVGLVVATHDLGSALVLIAIVAGALWVAGVPLRMYGVAGLGAGAAVALFATMGESRMKRIMAMVDPDSIDDTALGWQGARSLEALGTGGVGGVGLGNSRIKWLYLPEAHNDFILAVIGEELGLLGTLLVLGLFALLAVGLARIVHRHPDPFVKITTAGIATWLMFQALVNIGVVIGVLPVIGLPLPLISAGGSSLIATLIALGVVLAFARDEPGAREALTARRGVVRRSFGVMGRRLARTAA